jgi:hypothetical protein
MPRRLQILAPSNNARIFFSLKGIEGMISAEGRLMAALGQIVF